MHALKLFASKCWRVLFYANLVITFLLLYPFFYFLLQKESRFKYAFRLKKFWARLILHDTGIFYKVEYKSEIDPSIPRIYCPNHTSYLDIMVSYLVIPQYFSFIGKAALAKIPLFGKFFNSGMDIAIERDSMTASFKAMLKAGEYIDKGISINIFAEGTIPASVPEPGNFKNGPFKLAISKQVPIVPVTFRDNWKILPHERATYQLGGPGVAHIIVHEPILTIGMVDADSERLKKMVKEAIESGLK
jgi:1-acyl-sn-glycerol-3-phosphate acyltransferase